MASHQSGARTSAQTSLRQSPHGLQGGLPRNPEPHFSLPNQAQQRVCPCKRCGNLQQAPNCAPTSEVDRKYSCLQQPVCTARADFNGYGIHSSHWAAHGSVPVPAPQGPCHHFDPPHAPRSPHSNGMALGAASHGFTPVASRFSPSSHNQERDWKQNGPRMEVSSKISGSYGEPSNQVILYRWFLIRCSGSSQGVKVSVGGFLSPGTAGTEKFKTAAIVQRIEKCRLLAYDGLEVLLAGLIDDCTTISNGFSLDIVEGFFSGFPYTWNLLLNNELCASNPMHPNHQVSGNCGFSGGVETSQLSFEGSDQEKRIASPSFCGNPEKHNNMQQNVKQTMTTEVQSEKEAATLKINDMQPAMEGGEQLDIPSLSNDQVNNSNSTCLVEQEILEIRTKKEHQENAHVDQSKCKVKKQSGRASKTLPHVGSEEDGTARTQSCIGITLLDKLNGSTESVEKSDKHEQKSHLNPRLTRSMQKIRGHVASSDNISVSVHTRAHCDSPSNCEQVHTPVEPCEPCVKPACETTPCTVYQKRVASKRSRRTVAKYNDRANIDGGKSSSTSPSYYTGIGSPVEMGVQRPEIPINVEASLISREEVHPNHQEEASTVEVVQTCDHGTAEEEKHLITSVQKSKEDATFRNVESFIKTSQNELNKRENDILSKTPGQGSKCLKIRPRLPRPRVPVSKRLISAAFGLKTSRSGRLLVPPLAHWCGQALLRSKDGGIIGISEGSKDMSKDGNLKFMPSAKAALRKLRKRPSEAATRSTPNKKRLGTRKRL